MDSTPAHAPIVLHGAWVPAAGGASGALLLWGERLAHYAGEDSADGSPAPHPFAAGEADLRATLTALGGADTPAAWFPAIPVWLPPGTGGGPQPSPALDPAPGAHGPLRSWTVGALALDSPGALTLLLRLPTTTSVPVGSSLHFWRAAARLAAAMLAGGRYLPGFSMDDEGAWATWDPSWSDPGDNAARDRLVAAMPLVAAAATHPADPRRLLDSFLRATIGAAARAGAAVETLPAPPRSGATPAQHAAYEWMLALLGADPVVAAEPATWHAFTRQYRTWRDTQQPAEGTPSFRVCFRLEPPPAPADPWRLHFLLQATDDLSLLVPAAQVWPMTGGRAEALPLRGRDFARPPERFRAGLAGAGRLFAPIADALRHPAPINSPLTTAQAYSFLREAAPLLQVAGYGVLVPPWWGTRAAKPVVRLQVREAGAAAAPPPAGGPGLLGADALVDFDWQVAAGDVVLERAEFERLVALKTPLVNVKGQWVEFRPGEVEAALRFWSQQRAPGPAPLATVARLLLGSEGAADAGLPLDTDATALSPAVTQALAVLRDGLRAPDLPPPPALQATLRPYQVRGFSWLAGLVRLGLGACLADDMGLGKTIQTIALLLYRRAGTPALLICPTSVVGNWRREIDRFAPTLHVLVHQGPHRAAGPAFAAAARAHDLVLTSFSLLARDEASLQAVAWAGLILDEAQNIKNPDAAQTHSARRLRAGYRVALTGTPVENRLQELWSIMDFLNPGYLGDREAFRAQYALPIEREGDPAATDRLRRRVNPLILRRLKTDRTIIQDLPDKLEMKVYCTLTREQVTLYEAVVRDGLAQLAQLAGRGAFARRGVVLSLLTRLKQIVDHPALFLGDGSALPDRSGKLARLVEMLDEALAEGDKALIFTQFAAMGARLQQHLAAVFDRPVLYLHGGTPRPQRDAMVAEFQAPGGPALFVLSIKAGGVGLNLTAANHVFHYDRWWNPAVENQATDRAFRIGQRKNVQVHKLIAAGTLEERIDQLIESKRALAEGVVGAGEDWLAALDDRALAGLLALDPGEAE